MNMLPRLKPRCFYDLVVEVAHSRMAGLNAYHDVAQPLEQIVGLDAKARAALKPGKNILAVRCKQTQGGQFIDVGIVELVPKK